MKKIYRIKKIYTRFVLPCALILIVLLIFLAIMNFINNMQYQDIIFPVILIIVFSQVLKTSYIIEVEENFIKIYLLTGSKKIEKGALFSISEGLFASKVKYLKGSFLISSLTENYSELLALIEDYKE